MNRMKLINEPVDYVKLDYWHRQHHARYKKYVETNGLLCQECGGRGQYVEECIDYWIRYEQCGWCEGTGYVTRHQRGIWLREMKLAKKRQLMNCS